MKNAVVRSIIPIAAVDLFFLLITWLMRPEAFDSVALMALLFTVFVLAMTGIAEQRRCDRQIRALRDFLTDPDDKNREKLKSVTEKFWHQTIDTAAIELHEKLDELKNSRQELRDYQEFIEAWTHEIKTPLSLATLLMENHREEMSPYVYVRMEHVRRLIGGDVERILYYARLRAEHADYRFARTDLCECVTETLDEYGTAADEQNISLHTELAPAQVMSDKKVVCFILSQILSNAFKYADKKHGEVTVSVWREEDGRTHLAVRDNGRGVPPEDMPFLFDKGFTGNHPGRQEATGMGLYFVKKYAEALSIEAEIEPFSSLGKGFGVKLIFPYVE